MHKYSIILPVKNGGVYIRECVKSILNQSLPDFNLHILDSQSTDDTVNWINSLSDDRIELYTSEKPLTIEENWNRIISIPKNELMTIIGHDDLLLPNYLKEMDKLIKIHPDATLYQSHYDFIDSNGEFIRSCLPMDEMQYAHEFLACHMMRTMESMGTGYMMYSHDYDKIGGIPCNYPNLIFADYELWVKLIMLGYKASSLENCFLYRLSLSISKTTDGMKYQDAFGKYIDFIKSCMREDDKVQKVVTRYGKEMLYYYCESLSHRLLKTARKTRSITVAQFIEKCESYATEIIPGQSFLPVNRFRIRIAKQLDNSFLGRGIFNFYKKFV
jgi:glycosyltransferase involved in cell wall biosynthesis